MARRIYDAEFASIIGSKHWHLAKFWWIDSDGSRGTWTRLEAYNYVKNHPSKTVYVSEGARTVYVGDRENKTTGTKRIQTYADGYWRDNLVALAERRRRGLPNN